MAATDSTVDMIDDPMHGMITPMQKDILVKIAQHAELVLDVMDQTDTLVLDIRVVFRTWAEFNANWKEGIQIWNCVLGTCCKGQLKVEEYKTLIALANVKVGLLVDKNAADYKARQKKITASRRMAAVVTRRLNTVFENIRMGFIGAGDVSAAEDVKVSGEEFNDLAEKAKKFQADAATKASSEKKKLAAEAELAAKMRDLELREERLASEEKSVSAKKLALEATRRKSKGKVGKVKLFDDEAKEATEEGEESDEGEDEESGEEEEETMPEYKTPQPFAPEPADSGDDSDSGAAESVCITSFFPEIKKKTTVFVELVAGRRSPAAALRAQGKIVEKESTTTDYFFSVPSKGHRSETVGDMLAANRPSIVLLPITFLCRQEFKDAGSKAKFLFAYGPTKAHLDLEDGERVTFGPSMWVTITPSGTTTNRKAPSIRGKAVKAAVAKYEGSDTSTVVAKPTANTKAPLATVGGSSLLDFFSPARPPPLPEKDDAEDPDRPATPPLPEEDEDEDAEASDGEYSDAEQGDDEEGGAEQGGAEEGGAEEGGAEEGGAEEGGAEEGDDEEGEGEEDKPDLYNKL